MKKKIIGVLSLILAFVMCFALVACNGEDGTNDTPDTTKPSVTVSADKVATAFERFADGNGFKGEAKITLTSDKTDYEYTLAFDKRGDRVKCTVGDASYIVDIESGNVYGTLQDGKYGYQQYLPVGTLDYVEYMLGELPLPDGKTDLSGIKFDYNVETKTATYGKDLAGKLNKYITPITKAYDLGKPVKALIDDYLEMFGMMSVDDIIVLLKFNKNQTVGDTLDLMEVAGLGDEIAVVLRSAIEENLDEATVEKLYARNVGEIIAGLYDFIAEMSGAQAPDEQLPTAVDETAPAESGEGGEGETIGGDVAGMQPVIEEMTAKLLDYVLNREYTAEQVTEAINTVDTLINGALGISVKNIVDEYVTEMSPELYAAIKNNFKFDKLGAEFNVGLDINGDEYTVTGFEFTAQCKHNYNGEAGEDWTVLSDNNYKAVVSVDIGEYYTTAPSDFEITLSPDAEISPMAMAVVYGTQSADYAVKLEFGGNVVTEVTAVGAYSVVDGELVELTLPAIDPIVSFDAATDSVKIDKQFINTAFADMADGASIVIGITFAYGDDGAQYMIQLIKMPDTVEGLYEMIRNMIPETPDMPEDTPIEGGTEI